MFWDNSTDETGNEALGVRTCKENEGGGGVSECPGLKGQIRPRIGDGKVENIK